MRASHRFNAGWFVIYLVAVFLLFFTQTWLWSTTFNDDGIPLLIKIPVDLFLGAAYLAGVVYCWFKTWDY